MRSLGLQNIWGDPGDPSVSPYISCSACSDAGVPVIPGSARCGRLLLAPHGWVTMGTMGVLQSDGKTPKELGWHPQP